MTWIKLISCVVLVCLLPTAINCDEEKQFSVELKEGSFDEAIKANNHFIMFFAPWCGHCKRLHPLWEELAEMMNVKDDAKVTIAKVDCTQEQSLCSKNGITSYPSLLFFKLGEKQAARFMGTRDMPTITEFINQQLNSERENEIPTDDDDDEGIPAPTKGQLVELTEDNFAKHVSTGNHFVKFYAPWCSHCQRLAPTWDQLSKSLADESAVSIAKIDCTQYRPVCQDFEVKGYPTLLWIEDGKKIEKYSGTRDHDALKTYVEKMLGADSKKDAVPKAAEDKKPEEENKKALQLNGEEDFQKAINEGIAFIKFYAPWCGHCQKLSPTWDELAGKMHTGKDGVTIAKVDCTQAESKQLCVDQQVEGYPTLFAYKNGQKQSEYDGSRALGELQHYISKMLGHDEL